MNYQKFKKTYAKKLTEDMNTLGFIKGKSVIPTYWRYPCEDERLSWVVAYNFSARGNPYFNVLIGPYWANYRLPSQEPFPHCVGFKAYLSEEGIGGRSDDKFANASAFEQSIQHLQEYGIPYLEQFSSPEQLFRLQPDGILAYDLEMYSEAVPLLNERLIRLYEGRYNLTSTPKSGRPIHVEDIERTEAMLSSALEILGEPTTSAFDPARLEAAKRMLSNAEEMLASFSNSRWLKTTIKKCKATIEELG